MRGRSTTGGNPSAGAQGWAHLVGIGGAGMRALAEVLSGRGWRISGSDSALAPDSIQAMSERGWQVHPGHLPENLPGEATCCLYSPAVPAGNVELLEAARRGLPAWSYHEMVGRLMNEHVGIGIAGTHGKSTTTALVGWILAQSGRDPAVLCGAEWSQSAGELAGRSGLAGDGNEVVAECCEYRRHFLAIRPRIAAVLSVEPDHFDCYASFEETRSAFRDFIAAVPANGVLIWPTTVDSSLRSAVKARICDVAYAGETTAFNSIPPEEDRDSPAWWAGDARPDGGAATRWTLWRRNAGSRTVVWRLPGEHNVRNGLVAAALTGEAGLGLDEIVTGLETFPGLRRRFESLGEHGGRLLIDDYAHHPTEVAATIETARRHFPDRRIVVCFQPHQVSRTVGLFEEFAQALSQADSVVLFPVFPAREPVTEATVRISRDLAEAVNRISRETVAVRGEPVANRGVCARFTPSLDLPTFSLDDSTLPGDLVIAMGAGDIGRIHYAFIRRVQGDHAG